MFFLVKIFGYFFSTGGAAVHRIRFGGRTNMISFAKNVILFIFINPDHSLRRNCFSADTEISATAVIEEVYFCNAIFI